MTHVSYSELKTWKECSWRHKLQYIEKLKGFQGNEYTAFGTAIHDVKKLLGEILVAQHMLSCYSLSASKKK